MYVITKNGWLKVGDDNLYCYRRESGYQCGDWCPHFPQRWEVEEILEVGFSKPKPTGKNQARITCGHGKILSPITDDRG